MVCRKLFVKQKIEKIPGATNLSADLFTHTIRWTVRRLGTKTDGSFDLTLFQELAGGNRLESWPHNIEDDLEFLAGLVKLCHFQQPFLKNGPAAKINTTDVPIFDAFLGLEGDPSDMSWGDGPEDCF